MTHEINHVKYEVSVYSSNSEAKLQQESIWWTSRSDRSVKIFQRIKWIRIDFELNLISVNNCYYMRYEISRHCTKQVCLYLHYKTRNRFFSGAQFHKHFQSLTTACCVLDYSKYSICNINLSVSRYKFILASVQINSNQMTSCVGVVRWWQCCHSLGPKSKLWTRRSKFTRGVTGYN